MPSHFVHIFMYKSNSGSWWRTGRPGVLQFMRLQRVGYDWATELNWTEAYYDISVLLLSRFSCVQLFTTLWTIACQAPLSMGHFRQEYWSGLPRPPKIFILASLYHYALSLYGMFFKLVSLKMQHRSISNKAI